MDKNIKNGQQIGLHSKQNGLSEFYWACRNGDLDMVKQMLPNIPYSELNRLEENDSTPLHEATLFGHKEIVWLLLHERGCQRHQRNHHGRTAYEEAKTDEIRQSFHRLSNMNRFCDNSDQEIQLTFEIISLPTND
ncbi:unnamed protein product, partial [Didymodactylos carnosus]